MFFFFKQKTAYDMRISDWSSDVCSSDLSSRSANRGISLLPQIAFTAGQPTQTSRRRCFDAQTMPRAAISGWKIGGTGCARRGMCERAQSNCGVLKADSCTIVRWTPLRSRSEENTSELQSLMRISYAVFCLKKKKQ